MDNKGLGAFMSTANFELWKESGGKKVYGKEDDEMERKKKRKRRSEDGGRGRWRKRGGNRGGV